MSSTTHDSFPALFIAHQGDLRAFIAALVRNAQAREDIFQNNPYTPRAIAGMVVIAPICLISLLIPQARRTIGTRLLAANTLGVGVLILYVNVSKSAQAMMHV